MLLQKTLCFIFIAPHGITDIIYAFMYNKIILLFIIYFICINYSLIYPKNLLKILKLLSGFHFRHDVPLIVPYNYICSFLFTYYSENIGMKNMVYYLSLIHVPRHYYFILQQLDSNYIYVVYYTAIVFGVSLLYIEKYNINLYNSYLLRLIIGIINSHILFEEIIIRNNNKHFN